MAWPLSAAPRSRARSLDRGPLLVCGLLALLLHAVALFWLARLLQPPSLLAQMAPPMYTRTLAPEALAQVTPHARAEPPAAARPNRPVAHIRPARKATKNRANNLPSQEAAQAPVAAPEPPASASVAQAAPASAPASEAEAEATAPAAAASQEQALAALAPDAPASSEVPAAAPSIAQAPAASDAAPAFVSTWPADTRLTYRLGGNYRGQLHGKAHVSWQRIGTRYQAVVDMSAGLLASLSFSSQGEITAAGLRPEVYEEDLRGRRRGVRLGDDVRLQNGQHVARPGAVQDAASQFVELGHRFATGDAPLTPGAQIRFALARPGGVDDWSYDVIGEETLYLPRLGPVAAWHLKPRPIDQPRGPLTMEIWFAPSLQYLPVRILVTQNADTYLDLLVDTIEQR